jgi:tetratricopeptide (TPR) repeat protein
MLQARIQLKMGQHSKAVDSLEEAEALIKDVPENISPDQRAECLIIKGEVLAGMQGNGKRPYENAEASFRDAVKILKKGRADGSFVELNQKTLGWAYLNLMESSLQLDNYVDAAGYFIRLHELDEVEPKWLHEKAAAMKARLDEYKDAPFVYIPDQQLPIKDQEKDLVKKYRNFDLRHTALRLNSNDRDRIGEERNVSDTTVGRYLKDDGILPPKRGRKPKRDR